MSENWPGVLDHLAIGLVDTNYIKLEKIGDKLLLIFGLAHINIPLCYSNELNKRFYIFSFNTNK